MKVVKWSPFHDIAEEIPVMPLWISFPGLRQHLFHRNTLLEIASVFGKALCVDFSPASRGNMTRARVLVEIDVSETHPEKVWIGSLESGAFQRVVIEGLPPFCARCRSCGHAVDGCLMGAEGGLSLPHDLGPPPSDAFAPDKFGEVCSSGLLPCVQVPSVDVVDVGVVGSAPLEASLVSVDRVDSLGPPICQSELPVVAAAEVRRSAGEVGCTENFPLSALPTTVGSVEGPLAGGCVDLVPILLDWPVPPGAVLLEDCPSPNCVVGEPSPCVVLGGKVDQGEVDGSLLLCGASARLVAASVLSPSNSVDPVIEASGPSDLELEALSLVSGVAGGDSSPPVSPLLRGYPIRGMTTRSMAKGGGSAGGAAGSKCKKKRGKTKYDRDMAIALQSLFKVPSFKDRSF